MNDSYKFISTLEELKTEILEHFSNRKQIVDVIVEGESQEMSKGRLLVNLFLLRPFVSMYSKFTLKKQDLYQFDVINEKNLEDYFNKLIKRARGSDLFVDYDSVKKDVYDVISEISDISGKLNVLFGNTLSFRDFIRLSIEDEEADELFNKNKLEYGLQFNEIEAKFKSIGKRLEKMFKRHPESELNPFILAGTGINAKQLTQAVSLVGLKPDIDGNVIPVAIEDNYLNGLSNIENYFINCKGTRKALITNFKQVRKSGYLTRKLSLSMMGTIVDNNTEDCGSKHFIVFDVDSQEKLNMIIGRHYYNLDQKTLEKTSDELSTVYKQSTQLIGKKIGLRSPVTCACKDGMICKTCYGKELAEINKNLHNGLIAVLFLTNPLTQKLLSAKHLLSTSTEKIEWGEDFDECFITNMNYVYFNDIQSSITINWENVLFDEDDDAYVTEFDITPVGKKTFHYVSPGEENDRLKLYLNEIILNSEQKDEETIDFTISSKNFPDDTPIFSFVAKNNELSKSLQQILDLIESTNHLGIEDMNEFVNKFTDLLIENGMSNINSIHTELISSVLFRNEDGKKLDFSKEELEPYSVYRVSKAIMSGPLATSLAFERLSDQFVNLATYEKDEESYTDYLFK